MIDLTIWSLLVDISLMGSLIYLAYRLTRAESVAVKIDKVGDLEKTLRRIISDAEESSIELDQKLRTRQRDLETLLDDLKSLEERVNTSFKSSNVVKENLEKNIENCKGLIKKLATLASLANKNKKPSYVSLNNGNDYEDDDFELSESRNFENHIELEEDDELKNNIKISNYKNIKLKEPQKEIKRSIKNNVSQNETNISKEKQYVVKAKQSSKEINESLLNNRNDDVVLNSNSKNPIIKKANLASKIEKESYTPSKGIIQKRITPKEIPSENIEVQTFDDDNLNAIRTLKNRELARTLLKIGMPVNTISQKTNISVDEILEMKDETITESEVNKMVTSSDDARLGVLSKMRREIATL